MMTCYFEWAHQGLKRHEDMLRPLRRDKRKKKEQPLYIRLIRPIAQKYEIPYHITPTNLTVYFPCAVSRPTNKMQNRMHTIHC